jgi:hypothetical protein
MENRYRSLRIVAVVLRLLAVIVAVLGALFLIASGFGFGADLWASGAFGAAPIAAGGIVGLIVGPLVVALYALFLWASGSMINLFIDLERNTRATASFIADLNRALTPPPREPRRGPPDER